MSRTILPFHADDISRLARALRVEITARTAPPSHLDLLNMLARATGHRNFQHLRAAALAEPAADGAPAGSAPPAAQAAVPAPAVDQRKLVRLARCHDAAGLLVRWPKKRSEQVLALWHVWSRLPPRSTLSEREVNAHLDALHAFGDYALLRRELCDLGLLTRTRDGRIYRRVEQQVPAEPLAAIRYLDQAPASGRTA